MTFSEKTNFKMTLATFIVVMLFIISSVGVGVTWKVNIENGQNYNSENIEILKESDKIITDKQIKQDLIFVKIETDLSWIRAKLEDFK